MKKESTNELSEILKKAPHLTKKDIFTIPEIKENPLSVVLIKKFTIDGVLDSNSLVISLYNFVSTRVLDEKLKFLFEIYDLDGDGSISNADLFQILKILNKGILDDRKIQNIVDQTFSTVGEYLHKINFLQFKKLIMDHCHDLKNMMKCKE